MKIPEILYGSDKAVKSRCVAVVDRIAAGAGFVAAVTHLPLIDTSENESLLLLSKPRASLASGSNFVIYIIQSMISDAVVANRISEDRRRVLFEEFLAIPWSTLGLMCVGVGMRWTIGHEDWSWVLLDGFSRFWGDFVAVGPRYSSDLVDGGKRIFEVPSFLGPVLGYCGVPEDVLRSRLFSEGLPPLLEYVKGRPIRH